MRKFFFIFFLTFLLFINNVYAGKRIKIAVLDFSAKGVDKFLAEAIVENLITSLIDSNTFDIVERSQLNKLMKELSLQNSDDFNDELRKELGNLLGVELVILGSVTKIGDNITINTRGVDVETGIAKFAKNLITNSENDIPYLIPLFVDIITGKKIDEGDIERKGANDLSKKDKYKKKLYTGSKVFIGKKTIKTKWSVKRFYTEDIEGLDHAFFKRILIEVENNCAEFARVKIYCSNDYEITESENFILGEKDKWSRTFEIIDIKGNPREVEKVSLTFRTISCLSEGLATVKVYGIR